MLFQNLQKLKKSKKKVDLLWEFDMNFGFFRNMIIFEFRFSQKKYHRQKVSENDFQIPILESEINEKYRNFFLRIQKTPTRES